jgi:hypothetical protein
MSLLTKSILLKAKSLVQFQSDTPNPDFNQTQASARASNCASSRGLVNLSEHLGTEHLGTVTYPTSTKDDVSDLTSSEKEDVPTNRKSVSWNTNLTIKFINKDSQEEESSTYQQVCINQDEVVLTPVIYVMTNASTLDYSLRDFFYKTYFTRPMASNTIEEEIEDIYD